MVCGRLVNVSVEPLCTSHSSCHSTTLHAPPAAPSIRSLCGDARCRCGGVSYCADDWLLKFYFAAREVTNSIGGLRPVTLEMEQKTAEAQEAVTRLSDKQKRIQQKIEERSSSGSAISSNSGGSGGSGLSDQEDEEVVDESEGAGIIPTSTTSSTEPRQPMVDQKRRGGDADGYGIENWDLTGIVDGHTDYPRKIREILDTIHFRP